ncbi:MAG: Gfo/Idh/MocA family oxidoreductase [Clostridiales bacterium]|nr:Gfo/Idh/MocA family oxidoreductase [Clostridiales bacterium]
MKRIKTVMIGVGNISGIYLKNITQTFKELELIGVCDLIRERAEKAQQEYGIPTVYETMHDAFKDPQVELVLNLTQPYEHFEVSKAALEAGKHVYSEKPLGADLEEGKKLLALAKEKGLHLGGAPDTFLGAAIQTCRRLIDDGFIGTPIGSAAYMITHGPESWHPDPEFFYKRGGGPMFDMGPYYLTAMINLMGGVKRVFSASRISFPQRTITSQPQAGKVVDVDVNTYVAGTVQYESGAIGTIFTTFDLHFPEKKKRFIEIYGSEGTLFVPDPNCFSGAVELYRPEDGVCKEIPLMYAYPENSRGLGLADMAKAIATGREARCDVQQTYHVLEMMAGFATSAKTGQWTEIESRYHRAPAMVRPTLKGILD